MPREVATRRWLTVPLLLAALGSTPGCGRASLDLRVERAAAALFNEFETVSKTDVSRLPFHTLANRLDTDPEGVLFVPFGYLFESLQFFGPTTAERVAGQTSVILGGVSDFRSPTGFGGVSSRNCYVLLVKPGFRLEDYLGRAPTEHHADVPVWRWTTKIGEYGEGDDRASTLIAMQLNASYVLISNDAERIAKVAQAFATVQPKEVLARLSEWSEISTKQYLDVPPLSIQQRDRSDGSGDRRRAQGRRVAGVLHEPCWSARNASAGQLTASRHRAGADSSEMAAAARRASSFSRRDTAIPAPASSEHKNMGGSGADGRRTGRVGERAHGDDSDGIWNLCVNMLLLEAISEDAPIEILDERWGSPSYPKYGGGRRGE